MNKKKLIPTVLILFFTMVSLAQEKVKLENSLLWKIEHPKLSNPSYLLGTMHIMCETNFHISNKVMKCFDKVNNLVLEINFADTNEMKLLYTGLIGEKKISEELTPEQFTKTDSLFQKYFDIKLQSIDTLGTIATQLKLTHKMLPCYKTKSWEIELLKIANKKNMSVGSLEKVTEQIEFFKKAASPDDLYNQILHIEQSKCMYYETVQLYNLEKINSLFNNLTVEKNMSSKFLHYMLTLRNANWVSKMPKIMEEKSTLFAVGAGHLGGENGLINQLRKKGYKVTPVFE